MERADLVSRPPTEEVVTRDDLVGLLETSRAPRHYIGLEVSGFLHLGSLLVAGYKVNDFAEAGAECTVFLADWHTVINDKLGGDRGAVGEASGYYRDAFRLVCPRARVVTGSELYAESPGYWEDMVAIAGRMSLARTMRTLTIMGRSEDDRKIALSKLLYPPMQAADIRALGADIAHAGMDQRKIHMLAREVFPRMGWRAPVAVHHRLLPGLSGPGGGGPRALGKMSKSDPGSGIFMHDSDGEIRRKVSGAWCEAGAVRDNPVLEIARAVIFHGGGGLDVERPGRFGGDVSYGSYGQLEEDFAQKRLHPGDLKGAVGRRLAEIVAPVRDRLRPPPGLGADPVL